MTRSERIRIWKRELKRLGINSRQAAELLEVHHVTAYNWNSGRTPIPLERLKILQERKA